MVFLTVVFGVLSGCLLSVLVGLVGRRRKIGFGWSFLLSLIFTPVVGLICVLLSDPLPDGNERWGCIGTFVCVLGVFFLAAFLMMLFAGASVAML